MQQQEHEYRLRKLRISRQTGAKRLEPVQHVREPDSRGWSSRNTPPYARGHGGALAGLLLILLIAAGAIGAVGYMFHGFNSAVGGPRRTVQVMVGAGEGVNTIASDLQHQGLVSSSLLFELYFRINGGAEAIKAGSHILNSNMSMGQIAQALQTMPYKTQAIAPAFQCCVILAGKRSEEVAQILAKYGVVSYNDFMYQVQHGQFNYWFLEGRPIGATLEGYLYPGDYPVTKHYNAHRLVNRMLAEFAKHITPAMAAQATASGHSLFQIVTLASIVQRESSLPKVQRSIASVYYNRLANIDEVDMRLEADPTIQYALGYRASENTWWERNLTQDMIQSTNSPYNTYKVQGLPPGPISNPGTTALQAAFHPAATHYLYFQVLSKNGSIAHTYFCQTLSCQVNQTGVAVQ